MLPLIVAALACSSPHPPGTLLVTRGPAEAATTYVVGPRGLARLDNSFPAAADPRGTHSLELRVVQSPHSERLWLRELATDTAIPLAPASTMVRNPAWSPDGSWLAFESDAKSFRDLYRVGRDASGLERLTDQAHGSFEPSVATDGRIVFASSRDSNAELYIMGAHGEQPRRLTAHPADDVRPRWSPDRSTIAWISSRQGGPAVWTMGADGSTAHRLTALGSGQDVDLAWSPLGDKLAVVTRAGSADLDLRVVTLATGSVQLLGDKGVAEQPAWAPDGSAVAFTLSRDGVSQVLVAPTSGGAPWVACPDDCWLPRWLPAI